MIIGKIIGGLGNQMFQYAFYKYLSSSKKTNLKLDLLSFEDYELHNGYELEKVFGIIEEITSVDEIDCYKSKYPLLFKIENKLFSKNNVFGPNHFKENNFSLDDNVFNESLNDFYVEGYFQTDKYIRKIECEIRDLYRFKTELTSKEEVLLENNCVSIHIRGGDYLTNENDSKLFGNICTLNYYKKAIQYIKENVKNPNFLIFTNDIDYSKKIFDSEQFKIVDWNKGESSSRDMYLMSLCKHNIIANSSFSWWGAWLNTNSSKIVISPNKWFNNTSINQEDIIPNKWIRL